jgi:signal transduction histidine kinase
LQVFVTELDRARDLFLGMLGHDLRGPLSTIATSATLEVRTRPNDSQRAAVILRSVAQMKALLDDLVEYTRHRLGSGLAIAPAPLQLDHFARNTLDEIGAISAGRILELAAEGNLQGRMGRAAPASGALESGLQCAEIRSAEHSDPHHVGRHARR